MATLVLSAVGTMVGGPLGGALGALAGRQIDSLAFKPAGREGARLTELSVATSSYGAPIPAQFGRMRTAGTIIWATDLAEHRETQGGGKGKPSTTSYSYTASFAVALSSRPVVGLGRIWADGKLLRGAAGDLKTAGAMRLHLGHGDQAPDPLIAAAVGDACPAFRGLAYLVFENLQLAEFGNRIPALSFEVIADEVMPALADIVATAASEVTVDTGIDGIAGFALDGPLVDALGAIGAVRPLRCMVSGDDLRLVDGRAGTVATLPDAALPGDDDGFGSQGGSARERRAEPTRPFRVLRYYDIERDYQPGSQRAGGAAPALQPATIELPAAMSAAAARMLIERSAREDRLTRQTLAWRCIQHDPAIGPGALVHVPGHPGRWRVGEWEMRAGGTELSLTRAAPALAGDPTTAQPGAIVPPQDSVSGPTALIAFELPWDGTASPSTPSLHAAVSSSRSGWPGAALFALLDDGNMTPLGPSGRVRSVIGTAIDALPSATPHLIDRSSVLDVDLIDPSMALPSASLRQCLQGGNRALLGQELIQFSSAMPLGGGRWRLAGLLRGRGGTEAAIDGHVLGESFVLLDGSAAALGTTAVGPSTLVAAIGRNDQEPVISAIALSGITRRPLTPVHGRCRRASDGSIHLSWVRRARGAWLWADGIETPLGEQSESYLVRFLTPLGGVRAWQCATPSLAIEAAAAAELGADGWFEVAQQGDYALSAALRIDLS